jgi:hypothetical protein
MIKDSGYRRDFGTGAVRDAAEGKGRMDLMPLGIVGEFLTPQECEFFEWVQDFVRENDLHSLYCAFDCAAQLMYGDVQTAILEVAIHMEEGCKKYGDRNWEQGIPLHCYIDSACRHFIKWSRGDTDESHNRAALWNTMCAIWTFQNHPQLNDMQHYVKKQTGRPVDACECQCNCHAKDEIEDCESPEALNDLLVNVRVSVYDLWPND